MKGALRLPLKPKSRWSMRVTLATFGLLGFASLAVSQPASALEVVHPEPNPGNYCYRVSPFGGQVYYVPCPRPRISIVELNRQIAAVQRQLILARQQRFRRLTLGLQSPILDRQIFLLERRLMELTQLRQALLRRSVPAFSG